MFTIGYPKIFYLFFLVVLIVVLFIFHRKQTNGSLARFGEFELMALLVNTYKSKMPIFKFVLYSLSLILLIFALSNPQYGERVEEIEKKGIDLVFAIDVSNSMMSEDVKPNRLQRAKLAIQQIAAQLKGDRISIVLFAGESFTLFPLTTDYSSVRLFLNTVSPDLIPTQGTSLALALKRSIKSFGNIEQFPNRSKAVILITDGEDHEAGIEPILSEIKEKGIILNVIGIALPNGAPVPEYRNGIKIGYKKDKAGKPVISKLNEPLLQSIAKESNGVYTRGFGASLGLDDIYHRISSLNKGVIGSKIVSDAESRFQWPVMLALIFLVLESMLSNVSPSFLKKLNLFKK